MYTVPLIISINIFLIAANTLMLLRAPNDVFDILSRLPTAWGAFMGAIVGLIGVAWTAKKGFSNLIAAQDHRAKIEIAAREHQHQLDDTKLQRERSTRATIIATSIIAEMTNILDAVHKNQTIVNANIDLIQKTRRILSDDKSDISIPKWSTPIWDSLQSEVGLLGAPIAADLISVYSNFASREETELKDNDSEIAIIIYRGMNDSYELWSKDILHVSERLSAFLSGGKDPGPLFLSSHRRDQRSKNLGEVAAAQMDSRLRQGWTKQTES